MAIKAVISAGGTAGHINPAIAIARQIVSRGGEVLFIGKEGGMETELVAKEGFPISTIKVFGFKRSLSLSNIKTVFLAAKGVAQTRKIIKNFSPDVVIGCGGYVSGPAVFSATTLKIPTLIHEQNAFPGMTTRLLSKVVDRVCISFEESRKYFSKKDALVLTGNPVRDGILKTNRTKAREKLNITKPLLLVFGGSIGAKKINDTMLEYVKSAKGDMQIMWGTGKRYYEEIKKELENVSLPDGITIAPYIYDMDFWMAAADVVVGRAGAITISEICAMGKCSLLVPSPYVTNNHQEHNAMALKDAGAALMLKEDELNASSLSIAIQKLMPESKDSAKISAHALAMAKPNAAKQIYDEIVSLIH